MTERKKKKSVALRVQKAKEWDIGNNIALIDPKVMDELELKNGEVISIKGIKETAGFARPSYPKDYGLGIIRFDSRIRENTGVNIFDKIEIAKVNVLIAHTVILSPVNMKIRWYPQFGPFVRRELINLPVTLNDLIDIYIGLSPKVSFKVIGLRPEGICQIKKETIILIDDSIISDEEQLSGFITYKDVGGLEEEIKRIRDIIEIPLKQPSIMKRLKIDPSWGILLKGPPGCGKTLLAEAIMNEVDVNVLKINGPEILSEYLGKTEKNVRKMFADARDKSPSIIYIDQLDSIGANRDIIERKKEYTIVSELLSQMDGLNKRRRVFVIGATNRPDVLDPALLRPGRFDVEIEIKPPNKEARLDIFKIHTREIPLNSDVSLENLADRTHRFVGSDISNLCREAKLNAIRRLFPKEQLESEITNHLVIDQIEVSSDDFEYAFKNVAPINEE